MYIFELEPDSPIHILMQRNEKGKSKQEKRINQHAKNVHLGHRHIPESMRAQQHAYFWKHEHVD